VALNDLEAAWPVWTQWVATERRFLPCAGGLLDQPAGLMADLFTLDWLYRKVQAQRARTTTP
jgi:hypothetical protein